MVTKKTIDTLGGIGSLLASLMCLGIAFWDREMHHSMWKVWVIVCLILMLNGVAMLKVAGRLPLPHKDLQPRRP